MAHNVQWTAWRLDVWGVYTYVSCTFLPDSALLTAVFCLHLMLLRKEDFHKQMSNSPYLPTVSQYISYFGTDPHSQIKCYGRTGHPRLTFIFSLLIQTGPRGLSISRAQGACRFSPASTWRLATGLCPPSRSPQSCRPIISGRAATGRPTLRDPFRNYVVRFLLLGLFFN